MSKFSYLFNYNLPWLNSSTAPLLKLLISILKPGLYINKQQWEKHAFFVSVEKETITFILCYLDNINNNLFNPKFILQTMENCSSLSVGEFLIEFLEKYIFLDKNMICAYYLDNYGYFFINYSVKALLWVDGTIYYLKDHNYVTVIDDFEAYFEIAPQENFSIYIKKKILSWDKLYWNITEEKLEPDSLESQFINQKTKKIDDNKISFKLDIRIIHDNYIVINKAISMFWISTIYMYDSLLNTSPKIYEMLKMES